MLFVSMCSYHTGIDLVFASPWMTKLGEYKFITSYGIIDSNSKKLKSNNAALYQEIQNKLNILYDMKEIIKNANIQNQHVQSIRDNKLSEVTTIINNLEQTRNDLSSVAQYQFGSMQIEYGLSEKQNIGIMLHNKYEKFRLSYDKLKKSKTYGTDLYYKYSIYSQPNYIITFQPKLKFEDCYSKPHHKGQNIFAEAGILFGHKKHNKKYLRDTLTEISLYAKRCVNNHCDGKIGYGIAISDGIEFSNGVYTSHYIQYEYSKRKCDLYKEVIYEQIAIAYPIKFKLLKDSPVTLQIGYFWQRSLRSKLLQISGSVFALWMNI